MTLRKKIIKKRIKRNPEHKEIVIPFKSYQKVLQSSLGKEVTVVSHGSQKSPVTDIRVTGKLIQADSNSKETDGKEKYIVGDIKSRAYFEFYDIADMHNMFNRLYIIV